MNLREKLPARDFVRIHRSFIMAINKVERIKNKFIHIAGKELPIGSSYEQEAMLKLGQ